jgi:phospholipid-binding lipoprotein MlaA
MGAERMTDRPSTAGRLAASVMTLALLAGCATPPPESDPAARAEWEQLNDPLEPMNRGIFSVNQTLDTYAIKPAAIGYREAVPQVARDRVHDALENLKSPLIFVNDLLQGEVDRAMQTLFRAFMNTGIGLLGFVDVATDAGIPAHGEDLGQTLAVWGVDDGPYLVLPLFGPSNPRDAFGLGVEMVADPFDLALAASGVEWGSWVRAGVGGLDKRERLIDVTDDIERGSLDLYASMRSLYRQHRAAEIRNGRRAGSDAMPKKGQ